MHITIIRLNSTMSTALAGADMEVRERDFFFMLILHLLKQCVVGIELVDEQIGGKHQYESNHRLIEAGGGGHAQVSGVHQGLIHIGIQHVGHRLQGSVSNWEVAK